MQQKIDVEVISAKIEQRKVLSYKEELFIIKNKLVDVLKQYVKVRSFTNQGQLDILETGDIEMINSYIAERFFWPDAEYKLFGMEQKFLLKKYLQKHGFHDQALQKKVQRFVDAT